MRSTLATLSVRAGSTSSTATPLAPASSSQAIPTIRLISATPSAAGLSSSEGSNTSFASSELNDTFASKPTILAKSSSLSLKPKASSSSLNPANKGRLVPKKSKLSLLGLGSSSQNGSQNGGQTTEKDRDLSDVLRRVGVGHEGSSKGKGGFEIYVDPTEDPEFGEIVMIRKKKSRAGLDGVRWGDEGAERADGPLKEKNSNVQNGGKMQEGGKEKWWTIGRGKKEAKDKTQKTKAKSPLSQVLDENSNASTTTSTTRFNSFSKVLPRSFTPEPSTTAPERSRFNSLDSTTLLTSSKLQPITNPIHNGSLRATSNPSPVPLSISRSTQLENRQPVEPTYSRAGTPTFGGFLAPPGLATTSTAGQSGSSGNANVNQGSIALRAMRSVRSLARIGSWAQLRNGDDEETAVNSESVKGEGKKEKRDKEKKDKKGTVKKSKDKASEKEKKKEKKSKEKSQTLRVSTSSFEVGALSPARSLRPPVSHDGSLKEPKSLGKKRSTLLGLGLPSTMTMRLPSVRGGSNASSILVNGNNPPSNTLAPGTASVGRVFLTGRDRSESGASSLRPMSTSSGISSNSGYSARTSTASERTGTSRISNGSCASASVRWDEDALQKRRKEREREREAVRSLATRGEEREREQEEKGKKEKKEKGGKKGRESRRTSEGRKRTPINEVFPDAVSLTPPKENPILEYEQARKSPVLEEEEEDVEVPVWQVQVETATNDGHGGVTDDERMSSDTQTPIKKVRRRPMSEQLLGTMQGGRPKGGYFGSDDGTDGTMSILSAATNELAQLINNLDLEATPNTPDLTPLRPSPSLSATNTPSQSNTNSPSREGQSRSLLPESPLRGLRASMASITSLRPYAQSRDLERRTNEPTIQSQQCHQFNIGVEIAPWPTLKSVAPKEQLKTQSTATVTPSRLKHKRATMLPSPGPPPAEPSPVFQPLKPAKGRGRLADAFVQQSPSEPAKEFRASRAPSCLTFGSHSRSSSAKSGSVLDEAQPSPLGSVFKQSHSRKKSSLSYSVSLNPHDDGDQSDSMPIPPEAKRVLGMTGTMGASVAEGYAVELDASDPDSDIPDELQVLLAGQSDLEDTMEFPRSAITTASPPSLGGVLNVSAASDYPPFRAHLVDEEDNHTDIDAGQSSSDDDDTKKSFDFTGELKVLNESGASDRRSFVEQLENAFKTPAKLEFKFGEAFLQVDVPPVPALPKLMHSQEETSQSSSDLFSFDSNPSDQIVDVREPTFTGSESQVNSDSLAMLKSASEFIMDVEPMMLPGSDSLAHTDSLISSIGGSDQGEEDIPHPRRFTSSTGSRPSIGQLNVDFKFGGRPTPQPAEPRLLTLSDIIPSPAHQRKLSNSSFSTEDDSVLHSILAKASDLPVSIAPPLPRQRLDSDCSSKQRARDTAGTCMAGGHSRTHSADSARMSFVGFESFDEVRRGFEFSGPRPAFYPPPAAISNRSHLRQESGMSFASISSYGHVINAGVADPFDYALPSLQERPSSEDMSCSDSMSMSMSMTVDDTFSFIRRQPRRRRIDSDASSFYFRTSMISQIQPYARGHGRQESNMSVASLAPPVSLYNRSFAARHHRRNSSTTSASSVAQSYAMHGVGGGRATWARHRQDASMDSMMSEYSAMRLGRPGLGDKMFETSGDQGMPLSAISASPPDSAVASRSNLSATRDSYEYDSIMDNDPVSTMDDSLFDKTGYRNSLSSESIFGNDDSNPIPGHLLLPHQFRPLSMLSVCSTDRGPSREDDTMISMIGGGHVRRQSISSVIEGSPCVRMGRKKKDLNSVYDSPGQARIVEKPSIASTSSYQFGGERMIKAQRGLLARQSLEETCLIADGEDLSASFIVPVFSRPGPASRSRSSTCTSSSGGDTPPLSASDGSSISGGSQSSIDLSQLNTMLSNATHPMSNIGRARAHARARARGHGHHRRISQARMSRSSVYETIEEEMSVTSSPPHPTSADKKATPVAQQAVYIVDPEMASILDSSPRSSIWDDDQGLVALRRYYALRDEAEVTVTESKRQWIDTPFSIFALQSFDPPNHPSGMQALLEHSVQNYGPLPSELRPHRVRSRTQSRASPYPPCRTFKVTISPEQQPLEHQRPFTKETRPFAPLQQLNVNSTVDLSVLPVPQADKKVRSPKKGSVASEKNRENAWGLAPNARPRVGSAARRSALGWAKRSGSAKLSTDQKENVGQGSMVMMTPGETLRLNRPRPRGRATPASTRPKPIRV
ncbi:hypothetical protein PC9H_004217 [Pleurotus ostreatus]|uniref:Uncharacterized protein n=1 Tax=Pleurotus ostreatus TaxID=5322 RepID=A0A8H7DX69_PLEOS|nr:uncharacterized protein PC9H_004217 [Pleurotus ostreatus]KAF7437378.1 hypothetical protein PC9H_004217 [Pleurotus ostreatus]